MSEVAEEIIAGALTFFGVPAPAAKWLAKGIFYAGTYAAVDHYVKETIKASSFETKLSQSSGRNVNIRSAAEPQDYIYGKVRKGGVITNIATSGTSNKYLHMVLTLAGHEVNAITDIYINDEIVTLDANGYVTSDPWKSKIKIQKFTGASDQGYIQGWPLPEELKAKYNTGGYLFVGAGVEIAYLYVVLEYDQTVFANGIPNINAVIEGKKVYDPRDSEQSASDSSTWTFSSNPALCIADYLRADYGLGDDQYSRIDDTKLQAAANTCDESVSLSSGGTENRYECHGVLSAANTPADNLGQMLTSCNGTVYWGSGKWQLIVGTYTSPVLDLGLDDIIGDISVVTKPSARDNFNGVQGTFIDAEEDWITNEFPTLKAKGTFLFEDGGVENLLDVNLGFTTSKTMAQRLAKQTLYLAREQISLSANFGLKAFQLEVGDNIRLTIPKYGWTNKEFQVTSWTMIPDDNRAIAISMNLKEISQAAFAWNAEETAFSNNNTSLPKYNSDVTFNFTPKVEINAYAEKLQRDLLIDVTSSNIERLEKLEVQVGRASDSTGIMDVTGLINREVLARGIEANDPVLLENLTGISRKVADFDNDGNVDGDDLADYISYYFGLLTDSTKLDRIQAMHYHLLNNPTKYARYLYSTVIPSQAYRTIWTGAVGTAQLRDMPAGRFNIRCRVATKLGYLSDWVTYPEFEIPFSDTVAPPTEGFASCNDINSVELFWRPSNSPSLSHYEVRHTPVIHGEEVTTGNFVAGYWYEITVVGDTDFTEIGAASNTVGEVFWCHSNGSTYVGDEVGGGTTGKAKNVVKIDKTVSWVDSVARPANSVVCSPKVGTYVVRAFSKVGTPSDDYIRIPLTANEFDNPFSSSSTTNVWNTAQELNEVSVESGSAYYPTGYYAHPDTTDYVMTQVFESHNTIDIGSVSVARCTMYSDFIKLNTDNKVAETIDEIFGVIDNLGVNWDDIEYEISGDFTFHSYVKISNDNTTFSEWQRLTSNLVKGRYFKFKVEIESQNQTGPNFRGYAGSTDMTITSPSTGNSRMTTSALVAKVEY